MDTIGSMEICNPLDPDLIQTNADIEFGDSTYLIVWDDEKAGIPNYFYTYVARVNVQGVVLDTGVCVSSGTGASEYYPKVGFDGTRWLVVWPKAGIIQGRFVNSAGDPEGSIITIASGGAGGAAIAFDGNNYLVVYQAGTWPNYNIYGQLVSTTGTLVGGQIMIAIDAGDTLRWADVVFDSTQYMIVWMSGPNSPGPNYVHGQAVATDGTLIGGNFQICDNSTAMRWWPMVAASDSNYLVVWGQGSSSDVYGNADTEIFGVNEFPVEKPNRRFAGATIIKGVLNLPTSTTYHLFDALGREIAATQLTSGVYFIKIDGEPLYKIVKIE